MWWTNEEMASRVMASGGAACSCISGESGSKAAKMKGDVFLSSALGWAARKITGISDHNQADERAAGRYAHIFRHPTYYHRGCGGVNGWTL